MKERPQADPSCPNCAALSDRLDALEALVKSLGAEVTRLRSRKAKTSRTSSKPPSSDEPWDKGASKRPPSGKKRGGQPGHKGKNRAPASPSDVDETHSIMPALCGSCSAPLTGNDPNPRLHQTIDIPPVTPKIIELQLHQLRCTKCGESTRADLPKGVHPSAFGPNLSSLVVQLSGEYRMSRRSIQRFVRDIHGIQISLGAISKLEQRISRGLKIAHVEAMTSVATSPTKHLDETTWRQSSKLKWVWTAVGEDATVFVIRDSRESSVTRELIGDKPSGIVISDRYSGYSYIEMEQRQVCLAHLLRDFRRMAEGEEAHRWIGKRLLGLLNGAFRLWHIFRDDEIDRITLARWSRKLRVRMLRLLDEGGRSTGYETPGMCRGILRTEPAMWTFTERENVEPTNNIAERAIRPVVLLRKTSLGTQSKRGSRFVERMQTVSTTLKKTGRSVHDFIGEVAHAVLLGDPLPKLLA